MRWLFLLLLMLNGLYYVWHQQEAPLRAKEVLPLSLYRAEQQNIHLLSETEGSAESLGGREAPDRCLYLGGFARQEEARTVEQRLMSLDVQTQFREIHIDGASAYWIKIEPASRRLVGDALLRGLAQDFPDLKNKIMLCEGIATAQ
ncbi:hypothetical protein AUC61_24780 [Pseudomonas sp. S25]|uniref:Sporulation related domain-containing protein n=1 Tax=Pseudomonas maioricensis TaxID=1766623 RepID=A0ABS9ZQA2_9PSED|nr:hypothetical protein [Pseudomonas sp. S25]MCI8212750.1 hypothetical protein [Pseudomonas sp. S25]